MKENELNEHVDSTDENNEQTDNESTHPHSYKNVPPNTNKISGSPSQDTEDNEHMLASSKDRDVKESIGSNVAEERNEDVINEDIEITGYNNHDGKSQEYESEESDISLEEEERSNIVAESVVDDITSSDRSSIKPTTYDHEIKDHGYNLSSKRNRYYSKHIGKINMREDYIFTQQAAL